jgi:hypothetical protein
MLQGMLLLQLMLLLQWTGGCFVDLRAALFCV